MPSFKTTSTGFFCFFSGILLSSIFDPHIHLLSTIVQPHAPALFPNSDPFSSLHASPKVPIGLQWYRLGHQNPWSFSVRRTNSSDLVQGLNDTMNSRNGTLPRVAVAFTSLPKRLHKHVRPLLRVLKEQAYLPDVIYASIPKSANRADNGTDYNIPKWLQDDPLVTILRPELDYGPATKLIPALKAERELGYEDTRIVTVDDDNEGGWSRQSLLNLVAYSFIFRNAAIGLTGWNVTCMVSDARCGEESGVGQRQFRDRWYNFVKSAEDYACHTLRDYREDYFANCIGAIKKSHVGYVDVLEGYKGVLYQPWMFGSEVESIFEAPDWFQRVDDVWFSGWLGVKGVDRLVVSPSISEGDAVEKMLRELGDERGIDRELIQDDDAWSGGEVEKGLHDEGGFVLANHEGVRWFEEKGAWTKDMWRVVT